MTTPRTRSPLLPAALAVLGATLGAVLLAGCDPLEPADQAVRPTADSASTPVDVPVADTTTAAPSAPPSTTAPRATATTVPTTAPRVAGLLVAVVGVTDGDTLKVDVAGTTERVRVIGIDTPELKGNECYAQKAASRMQSLVQSRSVRIVADPTQDDRDRYGRLLRHVYLTDGRSVAAILIAEGFGREYTYDRPYAGRAAHLSAQAAARKAGKGVWSAACAAPPVAAKPPAAQPKSPSGACDIKGNISSSGEKIYHVPGGRSYDVTVITPSKGEQMFCSEADAVKAGWRRAKA